VAKRVRRNILITGASSGLGEGMAFGTLDRIVVNASIGKGNRSSSTRRQAAGPS